MRMDWWWSAIMIPLITDHCVTSLLRVLKFCIDRLSIDNAVFYHGTSPGTQTFWPLSGDFLDIWNCHSDQNGVTGPSMRLPMTTILQRAFFTFSCFTVAWVIDWKWWNKEWVLGAFYLQNKNAQKMCLAPWPRFHRLPMSMMRALLCQHHPSIHITSPRETTMIEEIDEFDSMLTKNSPVAPCRFHVNRALSLVFFSWCCLLLYNGKQLPIQASMTTYIRLYGLWWL
jgi:hypothetical protein